jgi:acetoin utilization deacetylase AcuC-like enzyme
MVPVYYSAAYTRAAHAFDTTRKATWIAESLSRDPIPGIRLEEPPSLTREQVCRVHDPDYVRAVETGEPRALAESQGFAWDPGLWPMVLASNGGVVAAARAALERGVAGSLSSGLHHARREAGLGFCTFNGLVVAAREALGLVARSVLILDLDAHGGGGTASLTRDDPRIGQEDVSVSAFDAFANGGRQRSSIVSDAAEYLPVIRDGLAEIDRVGLPWDLCLYNAGMDPCERCAIGGLRGIDFEMLEQRERMVFEWSARRGLPIAFVMAGGYVGPWLDQAGLVDLHRATLVAAAECSATIRGR